LIVVSDTSPLIAFASLEKLTVLKELFRRVSIPQAVYEELSRKGQFPFEEWIYVEKIQNIELYRVLRVDLGPGESESLCLGAEKKADLILLDDKGARKKASLLQLQKTGTLGILVQARKRGLISAVRTEIEKLESDIDFRISPALKEDVCRLAGE
jgi:predicted nucleic acid-binding protein